MAAHRELKPHRVAPVDFVCDRPGPNARGRGTLTIFERRWAFCRSAHASAHHWVPTGGVSIIDLLPRPELRSTRP